MARSYKDVGRPRLNKKTGLYSNKFGQFKKTKNGFELMPDAFTVRAINNQIANIRRKAKKFKGVSFNEEIEQLKNQKRDYLQKVKAFNKGDTKKLITVQRQENRALKGSIEKSYLLDTSTREKRQALTKRVHTENKIAYTQMLGMKNVKNGRAYDDLIADVSKTLGVSKKDAQQLLFPSDYEEMSKYEDVKEWQKKHSDTVFDLLQQRLKEGAIDRTDFERAKKTWGFS